MPTRENNEKMTYAKFIDYLEKNDPTGLSQTYFKTLIGKYEKTLANDGFVEADRKAFNYIKQNDPTGFIKNYYEKTDLGIHEKNLIKSMDEKLDILDRAFDRGFKEIGKSMQRAKYEIDEILKPITDVVLSDPTNNNKNLPKKNVETQITHK